MAFELVGPASRVVIDAGDEALFSTLPRRYGLATPRCDSLWVRFYDDPCLDSAAEVEQLGDEIAALRAAHVQARSAELVRERRIHARDEQVRRRILDGLLAGDPVLCKCDEIIALCREAVVAARGLVCSSD